MNDDDDHQEEELDEFDSFYVFEKRQTQSPQIKMTSKQRRKKFLLSSPSSHDSSITSDSSDTSLSSFSLSPSRFLSGSSSFETAELIDYSSRSGSQVYEQATEPLLNNGQLFNGSPEDLILFKHLIWERAINQGWMENGANIFSIPLTKDSDNSSIMNLLEHDGYFSSDRLREWAQETIVDKKTRLAQNDYQLFWCLSNSISVELKKEIIKHRSTYCINDTPIGVLYFHYILSKMESACSRTKSPKPQLLVSVPCFKQVYKHIIVMIGLIAALTGIITSMGDILGGKEDNNGGNELPQPNQPEIVQPYSSKSDIQIGLKNALILEGELIIDRYNETYFSPASSSNRIQPVPRGGILLYNATIEEERLLDDREYDIDDIEERNSENYRDPEKPPDSVTKVIIDDYNDSNDGYDVVKSNGVHIFAGVGMTLFVLDASSGRLLSKTNIHTSDTEGILPCWETSNADNCYFYDIVNSHGSQSNNHMGISNLFLSEKSITVIIKANLALKGADHFIQGYHQTRVFVYDISKMPPNNSELVLIARKDLQGSYKTAQMVGQNIHIVTSSSLRTSEYLKEELLPERMLQRKRRKGTEYENYLTDAKKKLSKAAIRISNKIVTEMENVGIHYNDVATIVRMLIRVPNTESTPSFTDSAVLKNLIIVYSFDSEQNYPDGNVDMSLSCIFLPTPGYTNPFYYSETNLVIAAEAYKENEDGSWVEVTALISLKLGDRPAMSQFQSYGIVRGSILSGLTMDLYSESNVSTLYLRIATTTWGRWIPDGYSWKQNSESTNYVTVLRMNFSESGSMMENVGDLKGINVGGRMFSCKFHEKNGYISTYEAYDPLYTLDLTNNIAPRLGGNITVYGYGRYIHPISEKFIIAISIEEADRVAVGGDTLQIKMFNVTDLGDPFLVGHYMESLGAEGEAIYNHQALRYIPHSDILIHPTQCSVQNPHLCGFDAYDVSIYDSPTAATTRFTRLFQILNHDSCKNSLHPRSLVFGNNITTLMGCTIKSTNILSKEEIWTFRIESQAI